MQKSDAQIPPFEQALEQIARERPCWQTLDEVWSLAGEPVAADPISEVLRIRRHDGVYYLKRYTAGGKWLRRYAGRSRPRAEFENLRMFAELGIPTAEVVGYSAQKRYGVVRRAALMTREIPQTEDLAQLARRGDSRLADEHWVDTVSRQLADYTARLHRTGFAHNDLKWRNILVTQGTEPRVYLIDCPLGRRRYGLLRRRAQVKDLACLDLHARIHLRQTVRLRFYLRYCGVRRLSKADKRLLRWVLRFFDRRDDRLTRRIGRWRRRLGSATYSRGRM